MIKYLKVSTNNLPKLKERLKSLMINEVLVGVPSDNAERKDSNEPNNAMLAYIHDNGSPAQNIPARPFMRPGIERAKTGIVKAMEIGAKSCLNGANDAPDVALHQVGLIAQRSIRGRINEGIAPPLAAATLRARIASGRAAKGAKAELARREQGGMPSATASAKPLIVTGQLRNSINYAIRKKGET
jgi:hypothetical protein